MVGGGWAEVTVVVGRVAAKAEVGWAAATVVVVMVAVMEEVG